MSTLRQGLAALRLLLVLTVLLGLAYPAVLAAAAIPLGDAPARLLRDGEGTVIGSALVADRLDGPGWFHSRPSAGGHDPLASGASNLGPTDPERTALEAERRAAVAAEEGVAPELVPPDALAASGSGLDPHISPAYAALQVDRVARENGLAPEAVRDLVANHTTGRVAGFLGQESVNVPALNLALARATDRG